MIEKLFARNLLVMASLLAGTVQAGEFHIGCNYWASHAGIYMWRQWDAGQVKADLDALHDSGVNTLRVFPLWPDFQPITRHSTVMGWLYGYAQNDGPFLNEAGVDPVMMERFRTLCDEADKRGMELVVGLITGWMSGRMFVPPAFEAANVTTDNAAIEWEVKFVRHFVSQMKDHPAILAWDLGNECNCMGSKSERTEIPISRADAWAWMNQIASAIRLEDRSRPVVSGMHSCPSDRTKAWSLRDQGELMDVLTTHPYPLFTPHCNRESFDSFRNVLHPVAESLYYMGVSGKPCFPEEVGCLGPNIASEEKASCALRLGAIASGIHGLKGYLWWCAFDQNRLDYPPYEWMALERELGLFNANRMPKATAKGLLAAGDALSRAGELGRRKIDAVCLVSETTDAWPQSFGAYLLSVQAGFSIDFASAERDLPDAAVYILPSGTSAQTYTRSAWHRLREKVRAGAAVILTKGEGMALSEFEETTGCRIESSCRSPWSACVTVPGFSRPVDVAGNVDVCLAATSAEVLLLDGRGRPFLTRTAFGRGKVVFVNCALERLAVERNDCFRESDMNPAYAIYAAAVDAAGLHRLCPDKPPFVLMTEHETSRGERRVACLNLSRSSVGSPCSIAGGEFRILPSVK